MQGFPAVLQMAGAVSPTVSELHAAGQKVCKEDVTVKLATLKRLSHEIFSLPLSPPQVFTVTSSPHTH